MSRFPFDLTACLVCLMAGCASGQVRLPSSPGRDFVAPPLAERVQRPIAPGPGSVPATRDISSPLMPATQLGAPQAYPSPQGTRSATQPTHPPASRVSTVSQPQTLWASTAQSSGQRSIEVARVGNGPQAVLFVGSIYGNEPESIDMLDEIVKLVRSTPPPPELTILLVRTPNPDGFVEHIRTNAHGVDLNRNFPSPGFTAAPNTLTGPRPASEAETQYMVRILQEYKPARVVHVRSTIGETPLLLINEHWPFTGRPSNLPSQVTVARYEGGLKSGSLEEYVTSQLKVPLASVQLTVKGFQSLPASEVIRFACSTLTEERRGNPLAQETAPANSRGTSSPSFDFTSSDGARGNVEFLPPPAALAPTSRVESNRPRYEELPPPPRP